jgi:hypothetical protein
MPCVSSGDAKSFKAQADDTYDKARDSKMYQGIVFHGRAPKGESMERGN